MISLSMTAKVRVEDPSQYDGYLVRYEVEIFHRERANFDFLRAGLPMPPETDYHDGDVSLDDNDDGDGEDYWNQSIGTATVLRLLTAQMEPRGDDIGLVCDALSQLTLQCYEAVLADALDDDFLNDCLIVEDIHIRDPYRNRGIETAVMWQFMHTLGSCCSFVFYWVGDQPQELDWFKPLGFEISRCEEVGYRDLEKKYPDVKENEQFCKFEIGVEPSAN